jgi:hypothetical protein
MKTNLLTTFALLLITLLVSCKGEKGDVGPAGESYDPTKTYTYKEGSITGTATGNWLDGTNYSFNLNFQGNEYVTNNSYRVLSPTETQISIYKTYAGEGSPFIYGDVSFNFSVTSLTDLSSPSIDFFAIDLKKDLNNGKYYDGSFYTNTYAVSNLSYDSGTGILTGNFSVTIPASSDKGSLEITNGVFSTKLNHVVAKMSAQ